MLKIRQDLHFLLWAIRIMLDMEPIDVRAMALLPLSFLRRRRFARLAFYQGLAMLRSTRIVVLLGIAVQITAFLRTAIIAAALGTSPDVDAYNLGLIAPTFISTVIGSWLQMSFIGRYTALVTTGQSDLAAAYRARMLVLILGCAVLLTGLCFLFPGPIMGLFMPAGQTAMVASAAAALRLSGLILIPIIFGDFIAFILNSHRRFFAAAAAPLVNALVSVAGLWFWSRLDLSALVWTLLLGSITQCLVVIVALLRLRLSFPVATNPAKSEVHTTLMLGLPLLPAMMLANSAAAIVQFRLAQLGEGVVAAYGYASRLHGALAQVLVIGLGTVLLPHFAALWSRGEMAEIVILFRRLARFTIPVVAYLTVGIVLMGEAATRILFQRGVFDAAQTQQVSWFWALLSLSLLPFAFGTFIAKFCQSVRDAGSILASGGISFAATWIITWFGASIASIDIVVGASVASFLAVCSFWIVWLVRRVPGGPILRDIVIALIRTGLILAPAIVAERWVSWYLDSMPDLFNLLLRGSLFTFVVVSLLVATGSHSWFLARLPSNAP
jgi:putative peptidoglycan lipid II flippase